MRRRSLITGIAVSVITASSPITAQTKLLRFPDIHGDQVAFTYAGDLWTASVAGGTATRLTAHPGLELFAKFSPDGKWIAFTGQYDGDEQVYVIPASGGPPKQLTFYPARGPLAERWGYDNQVYGWTPDGKRVLFRSLRDAWALPETKLFTVSRDGGSALPLPMPVAGAGAYSPNGSQVVYSQVFRDFRPEKRYGGGQANYLYVYDIASKSARRITQGPRAERDPMWIGGKIYYNSDKSGTFNLYSYDVASGQSQQLTGGTTWDVRWPSADKDGRIVYELNGELAVLDTRTGQSTPIHVTVPDDQVLARPSRVSAAALVETWGLSPKGQRALFSARGDIFTSPIEKGYTRNLTHSSNAHDKAAAWSPDGSRIAYISDATGEEELYVVAQDGQSKPVQLTTGGRAMRYAPRWSADGRRLAFSDKDGKLYVLTVADRKLTEIADDTRGAIFDYTWSPRGSHLAWGMTDADGVTGSIYVWNADDARVRKVTGDGFNEYSPAWGPEGDFLYFLSDRDYQPQLSQVEFDFATARTTGIYAIALRRDVKHPFPMESDEVVVDSMAPKRDSTRPPSAKPPNAPAPGRDSVAAPPGDMRIDFDGIAQRVARVPLEADNLGTLSATKNGLVYQVVGAPYYGRDGERKTKLQLYSTKDRKGSTIADDVDGYTLSQDGAKVMVRQGSAYNVYDVAEDADKSKKQVSTDGLVVDRNPREEWTQIFDEVWRRYRDFFYVKNMHGYDWEALRRQYKPLLQYVGHRADLNYVISEMISELVVQHAYIAGGDWMQPARPRVALPGARFTLDSASGRYRISKIFVGQNEESNYRSPLTEIGVDARVGEYVLAIDGEELTGADDPYRLLRFKADRPVMLTLSSSPRGDGARQVSYRPVTSESDLVYLDMVLANRKRVSDLTGGRVGYIHIPNMGAEGIREFIKWYYPQIRKEGLVVDVRANGGGNVSQLLIERLRRELLATNFSRTNDYADTYPNAVFVGPMVALLDENSASDGDIFPAMFKQARLGPLIGKRSWGGVVGITDHGPLIDGGTINVPEYGFASVDGKWIIEGYGVEPDVVVEQDVSLVLAGHDPQLERGVQEVLKQMETRRHKLPSRPADPIKTKDKEP